MESRSSRRGFLKKAAAAGGTVAAFLYGGIVPEVAAGGAKGPSPQLRLIPLSEPALSAATTEALATDAALAFAGRLTDLGYKRAGGANGLRFEFPETPKLSGAMVRVPYVSSDGSVAYIVGARSDSGSHEKTMAGLLDGTEAAPTGVRALEIRNGVPTFTESLSVMPNGVTIRDESSGLSRFVSTPKVPSGTVQPYGYYACDSTCLSVAGFLFGLGCSIGAFFMCLACVVFTGPGALICGALCAIFGYVVCVTGQATNAPELCRIAGYCTYHS